MKTKADILAELMHPNPDHDFGGRVLKNYLSWEEAQPFLTKEEIAKVWVPDVQWLQKPLTREGIIADLDYFLEEIAWPKVKGHRSISASLNLVTVSAVLWILDDAAVCNAFEEAPYPMFGAPRLKVVSDAYGIDLPEGEGVQRQMLGKPCYRGCENCGDIEEGDV